METVNEHPSVEVDVCPVFLPSPFRYSFKYFKAPVTTRAGCCCQTRSWMLSPIFSETTRDVAEMRGSGHAS